VKENHIEILSCPKCKEPLRIDKYEKDADGNIETGSLSCIKCAAVYPIIRHIPRFVPIDNYSNSFGLEWTMHAQTQYDSYSGANVSETRFFNETDWNRDLSGETILEAGCGSGRFTEQAASTGGFVVSFDLSNAVEANYASNGKKDNVLIVQADIYNLPFRENFFDKVFCMGVIQHTPEPEKAFISLSRYIKKGGNIVIDTYRKYHWSFHMLNTKYWVRPLTRKIKPENLYRIVSAYVRLMWPVCRIINKLPFGRWINVALLVADYRGVYDLNEKTLLEWAILDSFDKVSPRYDYPQTKESISKWFEDAGLTDIETGYGYNGVYGRGIKP